MRIISNGFREHFIANKKKYFLIIFLLVLGLVVGATYGKGISLGQMGTLGVLDFWGAFYKSISIDARIWGLILLAGCVKKLRVIALISAIIKGFVIGFTFASLTIGFGIKGLLLVLIASLPSLLFLLPILIYMCVCSFGACFSAKWLIRCGFLGVIMLVMGVVNGFVLPIFLSAMIKIL